MSGQSARKALKLATALAQGPVHGRPGQANVRNVRNVHSPGHLLLPMLPGLRKVDVGEFHLQFLVWIKQKVRKLVRILDGRCGFQGVLRFRGTRHDTACFSALNLPPLVHCTHQRTARREKHLKGTSNELSRRLDCEERRESTSNGSSHECLCDPSWLRTAREDPTQQRRQNSLWASEACGPRTLPLLAMLREASTQTPGFQVGIRRVRGQVCRLAAVVAESRVANEARVFFA